MLHLIKPAGSSPKLEANSAVYNARMDQNLAFLGYNRGHTTIRELEYIDYKTSLYINCLLELQLTNSMKYK